MTSVRTLAMFLAGIGMLVPSVVAQEKPKTSEESNPLTPLRVQVVLTEFEGQRRLSSMPYTFFVNADDRMGSPITKVRGGLRVPIHGATKDGLVHYMELGTNIDCSARLAEAGRFRIDLTMERSSVYTIGPDKKPLDWYPGDPPLSSQPIIRQYKVFSNPLIRDGQTLQGATITDPASGRVLKMDVAVNVVK